MADENTVSQNSENKENAENTPPADAPSPSQGTENPATGKNNGPEAAPESHSLSAEEHSTQTESIDKTEVREKRTLKISCHKCLQKLDVTSLEPFSHFTCPSCETDLIVPKWFDNYLLEEPGGAGGMATVYRALDLALDREVAIKILNPDVASQKERSELFLHEARTAATINHYAVIPIYTCGEFESQPYMLMQYMNNGSLEQKVKYAEGPLPVKDVVKWTRDIAEGLDNAKRHGIIHHDIKPGNIMLDNEGNAKIGDFGIAQAINDYRTNKIFEMTKSWVSPHYVSPEKVLNGKEDYLGDIYSLGATFYHLITGSTPFDHEDINELIRIRLHKDPVPPIQKRKDIPPEISSLIMSMMNREPEKRPGYREIIKILNTLIKTLTADSKEKYKTSRTISVTRSAIEKSQKQLADVRESVNKKKKMSIYVYLAASLVLLAAAGTFTAWKMGFIPSSSVSMEFPEDLVPEATLAFSAGNISKAEDVSRKTFENNDESIAVRKQAALQLAISNFLNNNKHARENCSYIIDRLMEAETPETDPLIAIIRFMEKPEISPEALALRLEEEGPLFVTGRLTVFLRNLYEKAPPEKIMLSFAAFQSASALCPDKYWGNVWKKRIEAWKKWLARKEGNSDLLEPLISGKTKAAKKETEQENEKKTPSPASKKQTAATPPPGKDTAPELSLAWLASSRIFAASRPKSADYSLRKDEISAYVQSIPQEQRQIEQARAEKIMALKSDLSKKISRIPYEGKNLELRNGTLFVSGSITGNERFLVLKAPDGKKFRLRWSDVSFKTMTEILSYYLKIREEALKSGLVSGDAEKNSITQGYLNLALFCDWYGYFEETVAFAEKAAALDPSARKDIDKYILK